MSKTRDFPLIHDKRKPCHCVLFVSIKNFKFYHITSSDGLADNAWNILRYISIYTRLVTHMYHLSDNGTTLKKSVWSFHTVSTSDVHFLHVCVFFCYDIFNIVDTENFWILICISFIDSIWELIGKNITTDSWD